MKESRDQFERVYQDCYAAVLRYAARRVAPEAVQDVVADTFLTAWRRYGELHGEPLPWLLGIARRTAANQRRGGARQDALRERLSVERAPSWQGLSPEQRLSDSDRDVAAALETLQRTRSRSLDACRMGRTRSPSSCNSYGLHHRCADSTSAPRATQARARAQRPATERDRPHASGKVAAMKPGSSNTMSRLRAADPASHTVADDTERDRLWHVIAATPSDGMVAGARRRGAPCHATRAQLLQLRLAFAIVLMLAAGALVATGAIRTRAPAEPARGLSAPLRGSGPVAGTMRLLPLTAPDPGGGPPWRRASPTSWAVRRLHTSTGPGRAWPRRSPDRLSSAAQAVAGKRGGR